MVSGYATFSLSCKAAPILSNSWLKKSVHANMPHTAHPTLKELCTVNLNLIKCNPISNSSDLYDSTDTSHHQDLRIIPWEKNVERKTVRKNSCIHALSPLAKSLLGLFWPETHSASNLDGNPSSSFFCNPADKSTKQQTNKKVIHGWKHNLTGKSEKFTTSSSI